MLSYFQLSSLTPQSIINFGYSIFVSFKKNEVNLKFPLKNVITMECTCVHINFILCILFRCAD